ncbi:hydroxymethylglutaryl-CoA lyase [Arthrobacter sp. zg-Y826]|uniref:hydroxymethylglutaryl-CoA lyase n=1 Tax=Arthrobacter jinronghuae TaxID=2964609 RepID=UPI002104908E|nr:hydroxymethylglutaryl-CoA lyase [Arthrobacter jinronghuae]MCQ1955803.1 hydroxymethylglutaryl-CoA lyase [Arthrobacter jinronghuae]
MPASVRIYEVGPRDGLQSESAIVPTETKRELVRRLVDAGNTTVELTSFVSPRRIPQLADAAELVAGIDLDAGVRFPVLVPNQRGLDHALKAGVRDIAVFTSATESFAQSNFGATRNQVLTVGAAVAARALSEGLAVRGYVSMVFGDPWEGPVGLEDVQRTCLELADAGVPLISLGDTIGVATPGQVRAVVEGLNAAGLGPDRLALHAHDTYGQALANVYAALQCGLTEFDSSVGGIGGCPFALTATGNLATEDLLWMLEGLGISTGIDLPALVKTSAWLSGHLGRSSPSRVVTALT